MPLEKLSYTYFSPPEMEANYLSKHIRGFNTTRLNNVYDVIFEKAKEYEQKKREKFSWNKGKQSIKAKGYTWNEAGSLDEIVKKAEEKELQNKENKDSKSKTWQNIIADDDDDSEDSPCFICHK